MKSRKTIGDAPRLTIALALGVVLAGAIAFAQPPRRRPQRPGTNRGAAARDSGKKEEKKKSPPPLPTDKRLLSLHKQFVVDAERLALEYEDNEDWDRAKAVYMEIVKLVPQHTGAQAKLKLLRARESNAMVEQFKVQANKDWQDTYIDVVKGKPVQIRAVGSWTFNLSIRVGPEGITIPEELREYNMGCLIAVIKTPGNPEFRPFVVGRENRFVSERDGRLYLRMYDVSPQDNEGELDVEVRGTYKSSRRD